ncbi:class I SAM-dependent methyltransferase [Sphingomonas flavalba]|uniref:class I SAM-dependent methyltransferase n=1 Tax=Sphingomonas flavalba TaxID=2559804 RepID=UPI0039E007DA
MADQSPSEYFEHIRAEIAPLLPDRAPRRILEIGSGAGGTLAWLKQRWPEAEAVACEGQAALRPVLEQRVDRAVIHNLEQPLPDDLGRFDLILALDVLEHLTDPQAVLTNLVALLEPGGAVIVSVPNVAHYKVVRDLLLRRRFDYTDAGIMDRTHLRFFTEHSALALMRGAGLNVVDGRVNGFGRRRTRLMDWLTLGCARHYLAEQYIMRGERGGAGRFRWRFR